MRGSYREMVTLHHQDRWLAEGAHTRHIITASRNDRNLGRRPVDELGEKNTRVRS